MSIVIGGNLYKKYFVRSETLLLEAKFGVFYHRKNPGKFLD
jgi:hypothetical protein